MSACYFFYFLLQLPDIAVQSHDLLTGFADPLDEYFFLLSQSLQGPLRTFFFEMGSTHLFYIDSSFIEAYFHLFDLLLKLILPPLIVIPFALQFLYHDFAHILRLGACLGPLKYIL